MSETPIALPFYVECGLKVHSRHATAVEALAAAMQAQSELSYDYDGPEYIPYGPDDEVITVDTVNRKADHYEEMTAHLV